MEQQMYRRGRTHSCQAGLGLAMLKIGVRWTASQEYGNGCRDVMTFYIYTQLQPALIPIQIDLSATSYCSVLALNVLYKLYL